MTVTYKVTGIDPGGTAFILGNCLTLRKSPDLANTPRMYAKLRGSATGWMNAPDTIRKHLFFEELFAADVGLDQSDLDSRQRGDTMESAVLVAALLIAFPDVQFGIGLPGGEDSLEPTDHYLSIGKQALSLRGGSEDRDILTRIFDYLRTNSYWVDDDLVRILALLSAVCHDRDQTASVKVLSLSTSGNHQVDPGLFHSYQLVEALLEKRDDEQLTRAVARWNASYRLQLDPDQIDFIRNLRDVSLHFKALRAERRLQDSVAVLGFDREPSRRRAFREHGIQKLLREAAQAYFIARLWPIHAAIHRRRERHSRRRAAHRGGLSVWAQHAGYFNRRPAPTPRQRTQPRPRSDGPDPARIWLQRDADSPRRIGGDVPSFGGSVLNAPCHHSDGVVAPAVEEHWRSALTRKRGKAELIGIVVQASLSVAVAIEPLDVSVHVSRRRRLDVIQQGEPERAHGLSDHGRPARRRAHDRRDLRRHSDREALRIHAAAFLHDQDRQVRLLVRIQDVGDASIEAPGRLQRQNGSNGCIDIPYGVLGRQQDIRPVSPECCAQHPVVRADELHHSLAKEYPVHLLTPPTPGRPCGARSYIRAVHGDESRALEADQRGLP